MNQPKPDIIIRDLDEPIVALTGSSVNIYRYFQVLEVALHNLFMSDCLFNVWLISWAHGARFNSDLPRYPNKPFMN